MKKALLIVLAFWLYPVAYCQLPGYWQQEVNYLIDVSLNDETKTLDGFEKITYINHSPDTLTYIWFHLWPNAYKNDQTALSDQMLENGNTKFYFADKEERGYINRLQFKVNGISVRTEDHPQHIDIIKVVLPAPLLPKQQIVITTPFHVKLPYNFSRSGYDKGSYHITQWYPKPAVYDHKGWHPMPYLDQGEFYSEFGNFDVRITVPEEFIIASTGVLQNEEEKYRMLKRTPEPGASSSKTKTSKLQSGKRVTTKKPAPPVRGNKQSKATATKTLRFIQDNIHDFAFFANKNFVVEYDTCRLLSGKIVSVYAYYLPAKQKQWSKVISYAKDALRTRSTWIGDYPYDVISVVQGSGDFSGGMEYPTITAVSPFDIDQLLDAVIAHEIGHNWFYGALASNERLHPWMDEGMNTFYDFRYHDSKYGKNGLLSLGKGSISMEQMEQLLFQTYAAQKRDQPIETPAEQFTTINYGLIAYNKTAQWLKLLEQEVGTAAFDTAMQTYYRQWSFKHPYPEDFKSIFEKNTGKNLSSLFALQSKQGLLPADEKKGLQVVTPFHFKTITKYIAKPAKNVLLLSPALGYNQYDKLMIGGLISNYKLPPSPFQFLAVPLYATGSKKWNGLGKLNYTIYPDKKIKSAEVFVNAAAFTMNELLDSADNKMLFQFQKLVPGLKLTFREKNARSTVTRYLQWKTFFINEEAPLFSSDTIFNGIDTTINNTINLQKQNFTINQLQAVYENNRALYPFRVNLQIEQHPDFLRPTLTANYYFNYAKEGGLQVRFFAGKFMYLPSKTSIKELDTDRFHLNMTGPNGYEDYTYSNYFLGRNKYEGTASQQIMLRDGAFKARTHLLANKIGKSDDWLMAANFSSSIPKKINPLSVLPIKIPLKLFADVGTYADAWEQNVDADRFLFNAGLQISLLKESIQVYIPLLYSRPFRDYIRSTITEKRFWKTISFSIQLNKSAFPELNHVIDL